MEWDLPLSVDIDGVEHLIRNKCEHRTILDCLCAYNDVRLPLELRLKIATKIFYNDFSKINNISKSVSEMFRIINMRDTSEKNKDCCNGNSNYIEIIDWEKDYHLMAQPISRVLGYSVRDRNKYTHWYDFIGAFNEMGDCYYAQILNIRLKQKKGKKLEKYEQEFYFENRKDIILCKKFSESDIDYLNDDE